MGLRNQAKVLGVNLKEGTLKCCRNLQETNAEYERKSSIAYARAPAAGVGGRVRRAAPAAPGFAARAENGGPCRARALRARPSGDPHPSAGTLPSGGSSRGRSPGLPCGSRARLHLQPVAHPHHSGPAQGHMQIQRIAAFRARNLAEDAHIQSARDGRLRAGHANRLRRGPA